jgi:hypothetical protein
VVFILIPLFRFGFRRSKIIMHLNLSHNPIDLLLLLVYSLAQSNEKKERFNVYDD